jgi:hypothetical protein
VVIRLFAFLKKKTKWSSEITTTRADTCVCIFSVLKQSTDFHKKYTGINGMPLDATKTILWGDYIYIYIVLWRCNPTRVMASSFLMFLDHTQRRTTVGRTPLDEWSARRRDLYLTTHNTHNRQISMPPVGFEYTISAGERPQTYALDGPATLRIHPTKTQALQVSTFLTSLRTKLFRCNAEKFQWSEIR